MMSLRVWPTLLSDTPASNGGGVSSPALPVALARLHWDTAVGETVSLRAPVPPDLLIGAGFEIVGLDGAGATLVRRLRTLPDTVGPGMRALVCGLNPSLVAADAGYGFAGPTNRFWPVAASSGLVTKARDPLHALLTDGVGMTDLVKRATPSAAELEPAEYRAGADRVGRLVDWLRPQVVLFVGLSGWRAAIDRRASSGWQPSGFGGARAYVMPSTSGLNARTSRAELESHMRAAIA
jgi:TDG/mug DNA glycosylase family protein